MPKLKQFMKNIVSDKNERAQDCFEYLKSVEVKLCDAKTGVMLEEVKDISISRFNDFSQKYQEYCLEELAGHNIIDCELFKPIEAPHAEL